MSRPSGRRGRTGAVDGMKGPGPSAHVARLEAYRSLSSKTRFLESADNALKLDWNECTASPSPRVIEALTTFLANGRLNWYPNPDATVLRRAVARYTGRPAAGVQVFNGSDSALDYLARTFVGEGDHVVICAPCYDNFRVSVESVGARVEHVYWETPFEPNPRNLATHVTPDTRLVYITNPNNPTGRMYTIAGLERVLATLGNGLLIVDEAYYEFAGKTATALLDRDERVVIVRTFSKAFGLAGLRCGYLLAHPNVLRHINRLRNGKDVNAMAQIAAVAALQDVPHMLAYVTEVRRARSWMVKELQARGHCVVPTPANFVLLRVDDPRKTVVALESQGIYVRDRSYLPQLDRYLRVTVGSRDQCARFIEALDRVTAGERPPRALRAAALRV